MLLQRDGLSRLAFYETFMTDMKIGQTVKDSM